MPNLDDLLPRDKRPPKTTPTKTVNKTAPRKTNKKPATKVKEPAKPGPKPGSKNQTKQYGVYKNDAARAARGVSIQWLSKAFGVSESFVRTRIVDVLEPIDTVGNTSLYDFPMSCSHLAPIDPSSFNEYIKRLKPDQFPPKLQKAYWDAQNAKKKYMKEAGELWPTDDVMEVFSETFLLFKNNTQLWVENLDREFSLPSEQQEALQGMVDSLAEDLYDKLIELPKSAQTYPAGAEEED